MVEERYSVRSDGQVTNLNFCQAEAPSTLAASYCSRGIASRPAIRISVQNGSDFQMCVSIARPRPMCGSLSQFGPSSAVSLKMRLLITPHSGLNMKRIEKIVGIDGTAQGRRKSTDTHRIHTRSCTKKPESHSANGHFRVTPRFIRLAQALSFLRMVNFQSLLNSKVTVPAENCSCTILRCGSSVQNLLEAPDLVTGYQRPSAPST